MTPVLDKGIDVTSLGAVSTRSLSSAVAVAGGTKWITASGGGASAAEPAQKYAPVSEYDYRVFSPTIRCTVEERENGGFVVAEEVTGIFGAGADRNLAFHDLFAALYEHLDVLERQESLSPGLQEQLDYLRALL